jgi:2-keto-4-pentenoate hydratase/2-oxohepta-3-ene-1,7-dioic acid hydratase in catechol pathway
VQIVHRQLLAVKGLDRVGLLDVAFEQVLVHVFEGAFVAVHVNAHDELEMAIYVGQDNAGGSPVSMAQAELHIFGIGLLNEWSARDIQFWEMALLGPFQGK